MPRRRNERVRRIPLHATGALLAFALLAADPAGAQSRIGGWLVSGEVELGGRVVWGDDDAAKFREYRDLEDGLFGSYDLLLENEDVSHWLRARSHNPGYDDQRYWLEGGRYGRYEFDLFYGELPHFFSTMSRTPYLRQGSNSFVLPPSVDRAAIEGVCFPNTPACAPTFDSQLAGAPFRPEDLELRWREGSIGVEFHAGESILLRGGYRIQDKKGNRNFGINFGSPGGTFISLPSRVEERIHEVKAGADWTFGESVLRLDYLANVYDNDLDSVIGDNPFHPADVAMPPTGAFESRGRSAVSPDNWAQSLALSASTSLPLDMPNRISGSFAFGYRRQDDDFLPHTINTAIPTLAAATGLALPRNSLEGKVRTLLGNVVATARPAPDLGAKFRYRIYDYDNQTDSILFPQHVRNDGELETDPRTSVHNDYRRQNADLDLSWDFAERWTSTLGFGWEYWHRSEDREVENLHEFGPSLEFDYRTLDGTLLNVGYEFLAREGSNYDAFAPLDAIGVTDPDARNRAKLAQVRKFDEANRYLHRFDLLGKLTPTEDLELTFTGGVNYADYHDSDFGLTSAMDWSVGADSYYQLHPRVGVLAYYTYEWRRLRQDSRYRPVSGGIASDSPLNDWDSRTHYQYHNAGVTFRLELVPERLEADLGYLVNYGREKTKAKGVPGGASQGEAENFPRVEDLLQAVSAELAWHFSERVTLRAGYRYEDYHVDDFRDDNIPTTLTDGRNIYLGDVVGDYHAHIFALSASFRF